MLPGKSKDQARSRSVASHNRDACDRAPPGAHAPPCSQIRAYYHRVLRKVNHALAPLTEAVDAYDGDDVRLALLSWCVTLRREGPSARPPARDGSRSRCSITMRVVAVR